MLCRASHTQSHPGAQGTVLLGAMHSPARVVRMVGQGLPAPEAAAMEMGRGQRQGLGMCEALAWRGTGRESRTWRAPCSCLFRLRSGGLSSAPSTQLGPGLSIWAAPSASCGCPVPSTGEGTRPEPPCPSGASSHPPGARPELLHAPCAQSSLLGLAFSSSL